VAFKQGDYTRALQLVDSALVTMPLDSVLHEFRALILFAQGNYNEAASILHPVLLAGPGWNWSTLLGLYPDVQVYTAQLRALERYRNEHKDSASARFLLAYQYLTCGHDEAAVKELRKVVALQPNDQLSGKLLQQLSGESVLGATPASPQSEPADGQFTQPIPVPPQEPENPTVAQPQQDQPAADDSQPKLGAPDEAAPEPASDPKPILTTEPKGETVRRGNLRLPPPALQLAPTQEMKRVAAIAQQSGCRRHTRPQFHRSLSAVTLKYFYAGCLGTKR
jgi:tetratricopeptide (TPR) repeat protein